ncbi:hypothetical protein DOTSEDRAFT_40500 [Dothistroma septosporum NZE10]|uniref:Uncharacterized protein n=1 Tax=Dothistroma septosporum (strain NZE10 / CBS 128990) TaxID=675120 RepID=N1Q0R2_DOTSN|nr:hypothetical protein DOTSEDRAFT_40500 [Dothistroma septosporum NZE10]
MKSLSLDGYAMRSKTKAVGNMHWYRKRAVAAFVDGVAHLHLRLDTADPCRLITQL